MGTLTRPVLGLFILKGSHHPALGWTAAGWQGAAVLPRVTHARTPPTLKELQHPLWQPRPPTLSHRPDPIASGLRGWVRCRRAPHFYSRPPGWVASRRPANSTSFRVGAWAALLFPPPPTRWLWLPRQTLPPPDTCFRKRPEHAPALCLQGFSTLSARSLRPDSGVALTESDRRWTLPFAPAGSSPSLLAQPLLKSPVNVNNFE